MSDFRQTWIVFDLEATCWDGRDGPMAAAQAQETEVIEIGAVMFDPMRRLIGDEFSTLVRPQRHPVLSQYCRELTHITQEDVDGAPVFTDAMARFEAWIGGLPGAKLASWGRWDTHQLERQMGTPKAFVAINCRQHFHRWLKRTGRRGRYGLSAALDLLGMSFEGEPHRAASDARNTARLMQFALDPALASERAKLVLAELERVRRLNGRDARERWSDARTWWSGVRAELALLPMVEQLPDGQGLRLLGQRRAANVVDDVDGLR